jgi:hypothetical protein
MKTSQLSFHPQLNQFDYSLLRFKKGQQENAAALPEVSLDHSMAVLAALVKHLDVTYLHIF